MSELTCEYCGEPYGDDLASNTYMRTGHVLNDCEDPDLMERAYLNASPVEREEYWNE